MKIKKLIGSIKEPINFLYIKKNDCEQCVRNFIFDGRTTGKLAHFYIFSTDGIYIDNFGNEIGDSIDLQPCDYRLDSTDRLEYINTEDFYFEYYGEENFDIYDK